MKVVGSSVLGTVIGSEKEVVFDAVWGYELSDGGPPFPASMIPIRGIVFCALARHWQYPPAVNPRSGSCSAAPHLAAHPGARYSLAI